MYLRVCRTSKACCLEYQSYFCPVPGANVLHPYELPQSVLHILDGQSKCHSRNCYYTTSWWGNPGRQRVSTWGRKTGCIPVVIFFFLPHPLTIPNASPFLGTLSYGDSFKLSAKAKGKWIKMFLIVSFCLVFYFLCNFSSAS